MLALPTTPKPTLICTYWGDDRDRTFDVVVIAVVYDQPVSNVWKN